MPPEVAARNWSAIKPSSDGRCYSDFPAGDKIIGGYSTTFPTTQSPAGYPFVVGSQQAGLSVVNGPQITGGSPGYCYGQDATATDWVFGVPGVVNASKHYAEVTIRRVGGYTPPSTHEIEIHVGLTLNATQALSYEFDIWFGGSIMQPVRWEDPLGTYNVGVFTLVSGTWPGSLADGDVVRVEYDTTSGNPVFTIKINGATVMVYTDTTAGKIMSGMPGAAFFAQAGATMSSWCIKGFSCGSL